MVFICIRITLFISMPISNKIIFVLKVNNYIFDIYEEFRVDLLIYKPEIGILLQLFSFYILLSFRKGLC